MLKPGFTGQLKKDYKLAVKSGFNPEMLEKVVSLLCNGVTLPPAYKDHLLMNSRNYKGMRECHIEPDWLLVYKIRKDILVLQLIRTGTHSDLF